MKMRSKYLSAVEEIGKHYAFPEKHEEIMKILPLVRNGVFLIRGYYGYGKTVYADLVGKVLFGNEHYGKVNLNNEQGVHDIFFWIDAGQLAQGKEVIEPRGIITSPFKFINELQRGNGRVYNALLSLLSEKKIIYRDRVFETPDFLMLMDANPSDASSTKIPRALFDRITASFTMLTPEEDEREKLLYIVKGSPLEEAKNILTYENMKRIWNEVDNIHVDDGTVFLLTHLIHNYLNRCERGNKEYMNSETLRMMCENCRWKVEPCSEILEPLGQRWWIDTIRIARARAYFEGRNSVELEDVFFSLRYTLPHRVHLRDDILVMYESPELWADKLVDRIKKELEIRWIPALNGNKKALRDAERTLFFLKEVSE